MRRHLIAFSLSLLACESSESGLDSSIQPAQPGCALGAICPAPVADTGVVPAPGPSTPVVTPGTPSTPSTPTTPITPVLDAGSVMDASALVPDASPPLVVDAALPDSSWPALDAQVDAGSDAALPAGDAGSPFPPVADVSAMGPYTPRTVNNTGPNSAYTIFHPSELAPNGVLTPIISWGNGGATWPEYYPQLPHLASHGFLVIASNNPLVDGPLVKAGVDWIVQQNETSGSPFYKKLDVNRIAGVGYSNGGLAQLSTADDPRYLTVVIISGGNISEELRTQNMPKLHTPIAYFCTDDEASEGNCAADFAVVKQPAFFGVIKGSEHTDITTFLGLGVDAVIKRSATATTAWFRWKVMGDPAYRAWFVGSDCQLCKDTNWTVQQKNLQ